MMSKTTLFIVFLTGYCFTPGRALDCLTCNNVNTCSEPCELSVTEKQLQLAADILQDSNIDVNYIPDPVCITILFNVNGTEMVNQRCANFGEELACRLVEADPTVINQSDFKLLNCSTCNTDNCNSDLIHKEIRMSNDMFKGMFTTVSPSHNEFDEQDSQVTQEHSHNTKTTLVPLDHNSTNNTKLALKSGSSSHFAVITSTLIMASLSISFL